MSDDLTAVEDWIAPLIEKLSAKDRRVLARKIARDLRLAQRERIKAQQNPDGSAFEPRKEIRGRSGVIRRKGMFSKLRTAKHMRVKAGADAASVAFYGRVARIADVHQKGLRARVEPGGPRHNYARRELFGFSDKDRERIRDSLIDHLT